MTRFTWIRALLVFPALFYLLLPTRNFYWDGVSFAINIESGLPLSLLFHPSHLIYSVVGSWLYAISGWFHLNTRALFILQTVSGLFAAASVLVFYKLLRLHDVSSSASVLGALVLAFSATWWKFATDVNAYIPSIFFVLCAYYLLRTGNSPVVAGLCHAIAMLFHELAILFLPVALLLSIWNRRDIARYSVAAFVPVSAAYILAYRIVFQGGATTQSFFSWIVSHSPDSGFHFDFLQSAGYTLRGTLRLFFGGKIGDFTNDAVSISAAIALSLICVALVSVVRRRSASFHLRVPARYLLIWTGVYVLFLFFWMPQNTFYRLFYLAPLLMLMASGIERRGSLLGGWLLIAGMFLWNFVFMIYPQSRIETNPALAFALQHGEGWPRGTPIVFHRFHPDLWTISYFTEQAAWISMERMDTGELNRHLEYARREKKDLWLEATAYEELARSNPGREWLDAHEIPARLIVFRDDKHEFRFHFMR